jgi:hypothetical protein
LLFGFSNSKLYYRIWPLLKHKFLLTEENWNSFIEGLNVNLQTNHCFWAMIWATTSQYPDGPVLISCLCPSIQERYFCFHRILSFPSRWTWFSACLLRSVNWVLFSDGACRWLIMYWGALPHWWWQWPPPPCNGGPFTFWIFQRFLSLIWCSCNFLSYK